jgi:hypothetical protein
LQGLTLTKNKEDQVTEARLSKAQLRVVEALQNGGHIWVAAGFPYILKVDEDGRQHSGPLNRKTFDHLKEMKVITEDLEKKWNLK